MASISQTALFQLSTWSRASRLTSQLSAKFSQCWKVRDWRHPLRPACKLPFTYETITQSHHPGGFVIARVLAPCVEHASSLMYSCIRYRRAASLIKECIQCHCSVQFHAIVRVLSSAQKRLLSKSTMVDTLRRSHTCLLTASVFRIHILACWSS